MAWDRRPLLTQVADKIQVRKFVEDEIGPDYLSRVFLTNPSDQEFLNFDFPRNFVIKPNHASGAAIIVWDELPIADSKFQVNEEFEKFFLTTEQFNRKDALEVVKWWLSRSYANCSKIGFPEWAYKNINPMFYIEELLVHDNELPRDFRFFMIEGKCEFISTDTPGLNEVHRNVYDVNWNLLDVKLKYRNSPVEGRPAKFTEMLAIAEKLSKKFDHIRVDLYLVGSRIVFGELTNYHSGGTQIFEPDSYNYSLAKAWNPTKFYGKAHTFIQ
jgi:hypothetical protein